MTKKKTKKFGNRVLKPKTEKLPPLMGEHKKKKIILCPFCEETHPIVADKVSHCGTYLRVEAVRITFNPKNVKCVVCDEIGGTFVRIGDAYRHSHQCKPGVNFYQPDHKKPTASAAFFYKAPDWVSIAWAKIFKVAPEKLYSMNEKGEREEPHLGYAWRKI